MYRLFITHGGNLGTINSPNMDRIRDIISTQYMYKKDIYNAYGFYVPSHHILAKLCYVLSDYLDANVDTYRIVLDKVHSICSGLGITSDNTPGNIHTDAFYTDACIIISTSYDEEILKSDWTKMRSVRCLTHQSTSMDVLVPAINKNDLSDGLAAVAIDIPLFAYQLQQWSNINELLPEGERESIALFLSKYILPGLIPEQVDIALRNRLRYIDEGIVPPVLPKERSMVRSYEYALTRPINNVLNELNNTKEIYLKKIKSIPFIFSDNYLTAVPMEIASLSVYSYWAVLSVFIDWVYPLTFIIKDSQKDISDIAKILIRINRYTSGSSALRYLPDYIKSEFQQKLKTIEDKFG